MPTSNAPSQPRNQKKLRQDHRAPGLPPRARTPSSIWSPGEPYTLDVSRPSPPLTTVAEAGQASADLTGDRLRRLVATCQDAVLFIRRDGEIVLANPAACSMFGYQPHELLHADVRRLMAEPYATHHHSYIERYERTGERKAIGQIRQVLAKRKNGEEFPIELSVTQLTDENEGARYGAFIRDVSEKVRLQAQLMDRERIATVGTTASMLVHEIGNPLNNMGLQLQALRRKVARLSASEDCMQKVDSCMSEVERLSRLVNEFRALSGRRKLDRRRLPFVPVLEAVPTTLMRIGPGVEILRQFEDAQTLVMIDVDKMQQVLLNLCHNAIEAMPAGGSLILKTYRSGADLLVEVTDTGTGIEPGIAVFEPFITTKPHGTGLGLAICSEIVREHGGTLTYETGSSGTTFRLRLPVVEAKPTDGG